MSIPPMFLAGVCVGGLGLLLHIVGTATTEWMTYQKVEIGLFRGCDMFGNCQDHPDPGDKWKASQAMAIMGVLAGGVGVLAAAVHLLMSFLGKSTMKMIPLISAVCCIVAFVLILLCVIIFGAGIYNDGYENTFDLGYSFALSIVGGILLGVGGALIKMGAGSD